MGGAEVNPVRFKYFYLTRILSFISVVHIRFLIQINKYPWMAKLTTEYQDGDMIIELWSCGATLIASKYVITAAHCVFYDHDMDNTTAQIKMTADQITVRGKAYIRNYIIVFRSHWGNMTRIAKVKNFLTGKKSP